jgi:hypothetical protein
MSLAGHNVLNIFYRCVSARSPLSAALIHEDIIAVSLNAAVDMATQTQDKADHLLKKCQEFPANERMMLNQALIDLGYSVAWID